MEKRILMSYNPSIPQPNDFLSVSQTQISRNFSIIGQQFSFDHVSLDDAADEFRGRHKKVTYVEQSADPTTAANDYSLYTKDDSGLPELYGRNESDGTVVKWTKNGRVSPALRLEAFVLFDRDTNILKNEDGTPLSYNIGSITAATPLVNGKVFQDDWIVSFASNISTANYFWLITAFYKPTGNSLVPGNLNAINTTQPKRSAAYGTYVTNSSIRIETKVTGNNANAAIGQSLILQLQVYTVA